MNYRKMKKWISGLLAAAMTLTGLQAVPLAAEAAYDSSLPSLTIDMGEVGKRELYHGATGWLYGLGDDQVPTANTITALKPNTAVQKAPNGMQHPNGDVLDIAKTFLDAGGKHIQIYVPDYYALWFYEFTGTEYYLDIVEMQAKACIEAGLAEEVVYVLYNEPNENWLGGTYHDHDGNTVSGWDSLNWFWLDMVERLREVYKDAGVKTEPKTAGLNLAGYNEWVMDNYIGFCAQHDCMPDIVSWHDLGTGAFDNFGNEYGHYRSLEKKYNISPSREIVINEYAAPTECASPGDLIRWIGLWEEYEVAGCLPFWHFSNNLNGLAADVNEGNGAWWLYKWYGDMSGSYLPVQVANANKNDFYGAASVDENKKNANVIFGGRDGSANIILDDILATETFAGASKVHVKVEGTDYTGFHGVAEEPRVIMEGTVAVENGQAVVSMTDMNALSAYHITVTQASEDEPLGLLESVWKAKYEAEDGVLTGNAVVAEETGNACSNQKKVHFVDNPGDSVTLNVEVPKDGYYKYDMVYCAATGVDTYNLERHTPYTAIQTLTVDGKDEIRMTLPCTMNWSMGGMYSTYLRLSAGVHTLKIEATSSAGKAVPDCIYLTYKGAEESDTAFDHTYEAELGEFNEIKGLATTLSTTMDGHTGYITGLEKRTVGQGGGVRFNAVVPDNGMYTIALRYQAQEKTEANIYLDNDMVNLDRLRAAVNLPATGDSWKIATQTVFLQKGINVVDIDTKGAVKLDYMRIKVNSKSAPLTAVEAESGSLTGEAAVGTKENVRALSSGGSYVSGLKAANGVELIPEDDPDFTILGLGRTVDKGEAVDKNSLTIEIEAPAAGDYKLVTYQSNGELFGKHGYNAQMTERFASFSVNGGEAKKMVFRNTYSDETFRPQIVDVTLKAGKNTIKIYNDNSKVITNGVLKEGQEEHRPENIDYAVLTNYTPNFDKFELYAATGDHSQDEDMDTYQVKIRTTKGGSVRPSKTQVKPGEDVELLFVPDDEYRLKEATVDGKNVMDTLTSVGGYYTVGKVSDNVEVSAYFEASGTSKPEKVVREADYEYAVNAGDINPATLSPGDSFGLRNSVTDQFYGEDPATGKKWGVVDNYRQDANYPDWLTGEKTWPCENDGADDSSPKEKSFRYARNQDEEKYPGVIYQFELEPGQTYDAELGFYVPAFWTNESIPRTMKLVVNDQPVEGYGRFTASNDPANPLKIRIPVKADADGNVKIQIGYADNAVWGPVVSYLEIFCRADAAKLTKELADCASLREKDYVASSWAKFKQARDAAQSVLDRSGSMTNNSEINEALYNLQTAKQALRTYVDTSELDSLYGQYADYESKNGQGLTSDEDWTAFKDALKNAEFLKDNPNVTPDDVTKAAAALQQAAEKLRKGAQVEDIFQDVVVTGKDRWPIPQIQYGYDRQIMTGLNETQFGQGVNLSRGQFATILYRMAGGDDKTGNLKPEGEVRNFPDVDYENEKLFYRHAVKWASSVGIIKGYEHNGMFGPGDEITREQIAIMLYRYADYKKYNTDIPSEAPDFPDWGSVDESGKNGMLWATAKGLITGDGGRLNPKGKTSRAVCATLIQRFLENVAE